MKHVIVTKIVLFLFDSDFHIFVVFLYHSYSVFLLQYAEASTCLSVGGLRQQFSLEENIKMSLFGAEFLRNIRQHLSVEGHDPPDVQFTPCGYLFLATEKGAQQLEENANLQK